MGLMALLQAAQVSHSALAKNRTSPGTFGKPMTLARGIYGPSPDAGLFEYTKLPLEEPNELLPDTSRPLAAPRWFFEKYSRQQLTGLMNSCGLSQEQRDALIDPSRWEQTSNGISLTPPPQVVLELSSAARERIYSVLAQSDANSVQRYPFRFHPDSFEAWLPETGLDPDQAALIRKLIYKQGDVLCFCDGAIVQRLFSDVAFRRLVKALHGEQTFLMRLAIKADSDINAIVRYWGKGGRAEALRPLFESMAKVRGGASINVSYILPTFARLRLYTFAHDANGPNENCFWTAMNFFNDKPDPQFVEFKNVQRALDADYRRIRETPSYGDLILLTDVAGKALHMCVYLADDVVFTKNGKDYMQPWVLMKIPDMLTYYNAPTPAQMTVYRSKHQGGSKRPGFESPSQISRATPDPLKEL